MNGRDVAILLLWCPPQLLGRGSIGWFHIGDTGIFGGGTRSMTLGETTVTIANGRLDAGGRLRVGHLVQS